MKKIIFLACLLVSSGCGTVCNFTSDSIAKDGDKYVVRGCVECVGKINGVENLKFFNAKKTKGLK